MVDWDDYGPAVLAEVRSWLMEKTEDVSLSRTKLLSVEKAFITTGGILVLFPEPPSLESSAFRMKSF